MNENIILLNNVEVDQESLKKIKEQTKHKKVDEQLDKISETE